MKKILIVNDTTGIGGTEKSLENLLIHLKIHYNVQIITIFGDNKDNFKNEDGKKSYLINKKYIYLFEKYKLLNYLKNFYLKIYFKRIEPKDVVIAFKEGECQLLSLYVKSQKYISWVHTNVIEFPWTSFLYHNIDEEIAIYKKFNYIITVSKPCAIALENRFFIPNEKICIIPNIIDYVKIDNYCCSNFSLHEPSIKFVSVGRLDSVKNTFELVRIFSEIKDNNKDLQFVYYIIGDGPEYEKIYTFIEKNNLNNTIKLLGQLDNPYTYMNDCHCLIHNSKSESFGVVFIEALYLGMHIITSECGIVNDIYEQFPSRIDIAKSNKVMKQCIINFIKNKESYKKDNKIKYVNNDIVIKKINKLIEENKEYESK